MILGCLTTKGKGKGKGKAVELPLSEDDSCNFYDESESSGSEFEYSMQGSEEDEEEALMVRAMKLSYQTIGLENQPRDGAGPSKPTAKKAARKARSTRRRATKRTKAKKRDSDEEPMDKNEGLYDPALVDSELSDLSDSDEPSVKSLSPSNNRLPQRVNPRLSLAERRQIKMEERSLAMKLGRSLTMVNPLSSPMYCRN